MFEGLFKEMEEKAKETKKKRSSKKKITTPAEELVAAVETPVPSVETYVELSIDDFDQELEELSKNVEKEAEKEDLKDTYESFEDESPDLSTCLARFNARVEIWSNSDVSFPWLHHYFWWVMHNVFAHFVIGLVPIRFFIRFHDWTSKYLNRVKSVHSPSPIFINVTSYPIWFIHNAIIHPLIGLLPITPLFKIHDITAKEMGQPDWI